MAEYDSVRNELFKRVEFSSQVQVYSVLLLAAAVPLIQYVSNINSQGGNANIMLLLTALIFGVLGLYQVDSDDKVADLDNYILLILSPRLRKALKEAYPKFPADLIDETIGWSLYMRTVRYKSNAGFWLSLGVVGRNAVPFLGTCFLLGFFIYLEIYINNLPLNGLNILLLGLNVFCLIWILVSGVLIRNKFVSGTNSYLETKTHS